jgi:hypothetical protein
MIVRADFLIVQLAPPSGHSTGSAQPSQLFAMAGVLVVACAITLALIGFLRSREQGHGDDESGPGRGGPERPGGDPGPSGADPAWWPEFQREFAAYADATARRKTDRGGP